ncbi:MAG: RluA family pseudouridine synthase [Cryobacterium sp.]|nr:RluA family pseudouridine synthase [Oligoflexia bacterium]
MVSESGLSARADKAIADALDAEEGEWDGESRPVTRSQLQKLIEKGNVLANGLPLARAGKLALGSSIQIRLPDSEPLELIPENIPLDILYEDSSIIVVNKQPGLTVHPSSTQRTGTLVHALLFHVRDLSGIGGKLRPGIVHRIDKDTSGALVITKNDEAHLALASVFAKHEIERSYSALVYGAPAWGDSDYRCETLIGRNPQDRIRMTTAVKTGKRALTRFRCLERYGHLDRAPFASLIEAKLETGRTHQVRVHLTGLNHSLLGDPLYGTPTANQPKWKNLPTSVQECVEALPGQALHARVLGFKHPVTGEALRFEAAYPPVYQQLLDRLREHA